MLTRTLAMPAAVVGLFAACANGPTSPSGEDRIIWKVPGSGSVNILPAFDQTTVFFGAANHEIVAVLKNDGAVRWRAGTAVPGPYTYGFSVVVARDVAVIGDIDLYAFDRGSGTPRWTFRAADDDATGADLIASDGEAVYAPSVWGRLYKVDAATGTLRWRAVMPGSTTSGPSSTKTFHPTIHQGTVYVGIKHDTNPVSGALAAVDGETGAIKWVREFTGGYECAVSGSLGAAAFFGTSVIAGVEDGRIYSLDAASGNVRWIAPWVHKTGFVPGGGCGDDRPLVVVGDRIVAGSNTGLLVGLDAATGVELWRRQLSIASVGLPFLTTDGTLVFLKLGGGELQAIEPKTGATVWKFGGPHATGEPNPEGEFASPPTVDGANLYVPATAGFYALKSK